MKTTIITAADLDRLDAIVPPIDMRAEISAALGSGVETAIEIGYRRTHPSSQTTWCYFPAAGRGGVDNGGGSQWTDANDLDDVIARWDSMTEDDMGRWSE